MTPQKVNSNDVEQSTSEIFELRNFHVIFADKLLMVKNNRNNKEFTITEAGFALLKKTNKDLIVLNRNHG